MRVGRLIWKISNYRLLYVDSMTWERWMRWLGAFSARRIIVRYTLLGWTPILTGRRTSGMGSMRLIYKI